MTYLEAVNAVLQRLRESQVAGVSQTTYSSLVGAFVNDAKRKVEDSWQWQSLITPVNVSITTSSSGPYNLASSLNERARLYLDPETGLPAARCTTTGFHTQQLKFTFQTANFDVKQDYTSAFPSTFFLDSQNSSATSGQSKLRLSTLVPSDQNYTFQILFINPQNSLTDGATVITVPSDPVVQLAYLYSLYERGEELGEQLTMTETKVSDALGDAISLDSVMTGQQPTFHVAEAGNQYQSGWFQSR